MFSALHQLSGMMCVCVWCLVGVEAPVLQLLLEEGAAHVRGIVQLTRPVVVQDLGKHPGMPAQRGEVKCRRNPVAL